MTTTIFLALGGGAVVSLLIQYLETKWNFSSRIALALIAVICGLIYMVFTTFLPETLQASFIEFTSGIVASAWTVYEFLIRSMKGEAPKLDLYRKDESDVPPTA